jgi:hypothetical protein
MAAKKNPIVTIARKTWTKIAVQAAGHEREGGGLLVGRKTRLGNFIVEIEIGLTHVSANDSSVTYNKDEVAKARLAAYAAYAPQEPVGAWHSHPWPACCVAALTTQISDDWNDPQSDVNEMQDGEVELVVAAFPEPSYKLDVGDFMIQRKIGERICRAEAWMRVKMGKIVPCYVRLR